MDADLEQLIREYELYSGREPTFLAEAYEFSQQVHAAQKREGGEAYFTHCLETARILAEMRMDEPTLAAGLLHDVLEDTPVSAAELRRRFGPETARLVEGVTKISGVRFASEVHKQAENFRKFLLATCQDIRVVLIKVADRLHNLRTADALERPRQERMAKETLELYAPLAMRLGMYRWKAALEDEAFRVLDPQTWERLRRDLASEGREKLVEAARRTLEKCLEEAGLPARVYGRPKNLYGIWRKMCDRGLSLAEVQDSLALRILTDTVERCYACLGLLHSRFTPVPGTFTDYIAVPKPNLYQSIHTTVVGPAGRSPVEVQIRTEEMHRRAEYGIAAHWRYKEPGDRSSPEDRALQERLDWLKEVLDWQRDMKDPKEFLACLKSDLEFDRVYVLTPKGDVKPLPKGATPVDFAYAVHTDIGNHCRGAKVNGKIVSLRKPLQSGDICEILTSRSARPSRDWLEFVRTSVARGKIRRALGL